MIPSVIYEGCGSPGEIELFHRFSREAGTESWTVLHSVNIAKHVSQIEGEADFVIIVPRLGVLCLEVKSHLAIARDAGRWILGTNAHPVSPFVQASTAMWSLVHHVKERDSRLRTIMFASACAFTGCNFSAESIEWHPWQVMDREALRTPIAPTIERMLRMQREHIERSGKLGVKSGEPTPLQCDQLLAALRPRFEFYESPRDRQRRVDGELKRYTDEQYRVLEALDANPRLIVRGPAGTGKSLLAIEAARRAASGIHAGLPRPAGSRRVLMLCFNRLLGEWLKQQGEGAGVSVSTISRYMLDVCGIEAPRDAGRRFWDDELPARAAEALLSRSDPGRLWETVVVDEAQDVLRPDFLDVLDLSIEGGLKGGRWRMFGDFENQAIYARKQELQRIANDVASSSVVVDLRDNCRNTPAVAALVRLLGGLSPDYRRVLRPNDGTEPEVCYYETADEQVDALAAQLEKVVKAGFRESEITVLSPRADGSCATRLEARGSWKSRLRSLRDSRHRDLIVHGTVHSFKGLEAPVVVLTDIEEIASEDAQALFYIGTTRATSRLVVLANGNVREQVLGILTGQSQEHRHG